MSTNRDLERIYGTGTPISDQYPASQRADEKASELKDRADEKASELKDRTSEKASELKDRIVDKASELKDRSAEKADELKDRSTQAAHQASDRVDSLMTATGSQMSNLAQTVRKNAPEGQLGEVASKAAQMLDRGGDHLKRTNPEMIRNDIERVIRDHPLEAVALGLGIGFLLRKSMK